MGRQERFKSKMKESRDSRDSTNAYSEDKIRYFFQDEHKPRQSEFLKTLIEKSHRKKSCALKNIYASIQARQKRDSMKKKKKQAPVPSQRKFIQLRESSDRKGSPEKVSKTEHCRLSGTGRAIAKSKRGSRYDNLPFESEHRKRNNVITDSRSQNVGFNSSQPHHRLNLTRKIKEATGKKQKGEFGENNNNNKNHYLLTSFSRNKSKRVNKKPVGQRTEIGERIPSSKRGVGNFTSLNYCSVQAEFELQVGTPIQKRL